jgi:hypothetical protein
MLACVPLRCRHKEINEESMYRISCLSEAMLKNMLPLLLTNHLSWRGAGEREACRRLGVQRPKRAVNHHVHALALLSK